MRNIFTEIEPREYALILSNIGNKLKIKDWVNYHGRDYDNPDKLSEPDKHVVLYIKSSEFNILVDPYASMSEMGYSHLGYHIKHDVEFVVSEDKTCITLQCKNCGISIFDVIRTDGEPHLIPTFEKKDKVVKKKKFKCCKDGMGCKKRCAEKSKYRENVFPSPTEKSLADSMHEIGVSIEIDMVIPGDFRDKYPVGSKVTLEFEVRQSSEDILRTRDVNGEVATNLVITLGE